MRKVRCVSPHGGAHHGTDAEGDPVGPGYTGPMMNPPHEGGYVDNAVLGRVAVGDELDAPEPPEFIADGFHFVDITTGQGDVCQSPGDGCWCGGAHHLAEGAGGNDSVNTAVTGDAGGSAPPGLVVTAGTPAAGGGAGGTLADLLGKGDS